MSSDEVPARSKRFPFFGVFVAVAFVLLGAAMLSWAWSGAGGTAEIHWPGLRELLASDTAQADGTVVRSGGFSMPASQGSVYPVVRFEVDGKSHELKGVGRESEYLEPGTHVTVVYQRNNPAVAHLAGLNQAMPAIMLSGGGALLLGFSMLALVFLFRRDPAQRSDA